LARSIILDLAVHDAMNPDEPTLPDHSPASSPPPPSASRAGEADLSFASCAGGADLSDPTRHDKPGLRQMSSGVRLPETPNRAGEDVVRADEAQAPSTSWRRAVTRARWIVSRLGPDPEHNGLIFLPGRLDPRNASTSLIDAGECVDALTTLALHGRFRDLSAADQEAIVSGIRACAATYLVATVASKAIVNQVLWGAMGLAHACTLSLKKSRGAVPSWTRWRSRSIDSAPMGRGAMKRRRSRHTRASRT
jgi:hypothetical protein